MAEQTSLLTDRLRELSRKESLEPDVSRAALVTVALIVPLTISYMWGKSQEGVLAATTAQLLASAKIQGSYPTRAFILLMGTLAVALSSFAGTLAGEYWGSAILLMALVAAVASLARGLGDHGTVLGICAVLLFLVSLNPPHDAHTAFSRVGKILLGGAWATVLTLFFWPIRPQRPFYLALAKPWEIGCSLIRSVSEEGVRAEERETQLIQRENALRQAANRIFPLLQNQPDRTVVRREALKIVRAASRFGATAIALHDELQSLLLREPDYSGISVVREALTATSQAARAVTNTLLSPQEAGYILAQETVQRATVPLGKLKQLVPQQGNTSHEVMRMVTLLELAIRYLYDVLMLLDRLEEKQSGVSLIGKFNIGYRLQTIWQKTLLQLQPNSPLLRHSLRVGLVAFVGVSLYYFFAIPRGYWIVLTVMVVLQPDFGTTKQKAGQRVIGTLIGGALGTLLLIHPFHPALLVIAIAACSFLFVYFQPRNYKVSVVFVTMMLVAMLEVAGPIDWHIAAYRLLSTTIGGTLAVAGAYLLWPTWERRQFPERMAKAIRANKNYLQQIGYELQFKTGFHTRVIADQRKAEVENTNLTDSVQRLSLEPAHPHTDLKRAQLLAQHNARLTRELTAFAAFLPSLIQEGAYFPEAQQLFQHSANRLERLAEFIETGIRGDAQSDGTVFLTNMARKIQESRSHGSLVAASTKPAAQEWITWEFIHSHGERIAEEISHLWQIALQSGEEGSKN